MEPWKPDIVDWSVVDEPKARFMLDEAKAQLRATLEAGKQIEAKSFNLLGIVILFMNGLIAYVVHEAPSLGWYAAPVLAYVGVLVYCSVVLARNILPSRIHFEGNIPKNLMRNDKLKQ